MDVEIVVLVADDETLGKMVLQSHLSLQPYGGETPSSGQEALDKRATLSPDRILPDLGVSGVFPDEKAPSSIISGRPSHI